MGGKPDDTVTCFNRRLALFLRQARDGLVVAWWATGLDCRRWKPVASSVPSRSTIASRERTWEGRINFGRLGWDCHTTHAHTSESIREVNKVQNRLLVVVETLSHVDIKKKNDF